MPGLRFPPRLPTPRPALREQKGRGAARQESWGSSPGVDETGDVRESAAQQVTSA